MNPRHLFWTVMTFIATSLVSAAERPKYPPSKTDNVVDKLHGVEVADPYRWLEDGKSAEVKEWTEKQNAFTKAFLDGLPNREAIRKRLDTLTKIGSVGTPTPRKGRYFYSKREGEQNQPILYVRDGVNGADRGSHGRFVPPFFPDRFVRRSEQRH